MRQLTATPGSWEAVPSDIKPDVTPAWFDIQSPQGYGVAFALDEGDARAVALLPEILDTCQQLIADADTRPGAYIYADHAALDRIRALLDSLSTTTTGGTS